MAANGGKIQYTIGFNVDKSGLNQITRSLQEVQNAAASNKDQGLAKQFDQAAAAAKKLEQIINGSWNDKLNQLNLDKFNQSIKTSFGSVQNLKKQLVNGTAQGQAAFNSIASSVLNTNVQLRQSNTLLDKMATSMANTVKWGITASIFNKITGSIQSAYNYAKNLNSSLIDIRMVTGDSADEMQRFAKNANQVSQALGRSTLDYTKSAVEYYRQGLSDEQVAARTEVTLKAQNVTGAGSQMVDYLTAVWNGFKINTQNAEAAVDSLAKVADSSASDLAELATAMSKVAATANVVGVDFDQLNAMIATVVATTRLAPESVGTAFKTIFARINDIRTGSDEAQISLGNYSGRMAELGINVLDASGRLRDTGDVITDIGNKWGELTKQQQTYLASTMGGQRQITQVMALFDNWSSYVDLLNTSLNANGTLNEKNNIYLESTAAHMQQLSTEAQRLYAALIDTDAINPLIDTLKGALDIFNDFIEGIGGGTKTFAYFGSLVAGIFSKQIAQSINQAQQSFLRFRANVGSQKAKQSMVGVLTQNIQSASIIGNGQILGQHALAKQAEAMEKTLGIQKFLTVEQQQEVLEIQKQIGLLNQKIDDLELEDRIRQSNIQAARQLTGLEEASIYQVQQAYDIQQRKVQSIDKELSLFNMIQQATFDEVHTQQERNALAQQLNQRTQVFRDLYQQATGSTKGFQNNWNNIIAQIKAGTGHLKNWQNIQQNLRGLQSQEHSILSAQKYLLQNLGIDTSKLTQDYKAQLVLLQKQNQARAQQAAHIKKIQTVTRAASAVGMALTSLTGALETFGKQGATAAQKANAAFSGLQGTISAIGMATGPWGMAISTLVNGLISGAKAIFGDQIEQLFMTIDERVQKYQQKAQKALQEAGKKSKEIASLKQIQKQYDQLSAAAGAYGSTIDNLTQEQQQRYHEITNQFAEYNKQVIVGYDEQGNAIVRNNSALSETIALLEQLQGKAALDAIGGSVSGFLKSQQDIANDKPEEDINNIAAEISNPTQSDIINALGNLYGLAQMGSQGLSYVNTLLGGLQGEINEINNTPITIAPSFSEKTLTDSFADWVLQLSKQLSQGVDSAAQFELQISGWTSILKTLKGKVTEGTEGAEALDQAIRNLEAIEFPEYHAKELFDQLQQGVDFPVSSILTVIKYGDEGFNQAYKQLYNSDFYNQGVESLIYEIASGWGITEEGSSLDLENKTGTAIDIVNWINTYIKNLTNALSMAEDSFGNIKPDKILKGSENINETITKVYNKIRQAIKTAKTTEEFKSLETDEERQAYLQSITDAIASMFDMSGLKVDADGIIDLSGLQYTVKELADLSSKEINNYLKTFASQGLDIEGIQIDVSSFIKNVDVEDFYDTISNFDWVEFFARLNQGLPENADNQEAFIQQLLIDMFKEASQQSVKMLDFNTLIEPDTLIDNLDKKKDLRDQQNAVLDQLESRYSGLAEIEARTWRGSPQYIEFLKTIKDNIVDIAEEQIQTQKAQAQADIQYGKDTLAAYEGIDKNTTAEQIKQLLPDIKEEQLNLIVDAQNKINLGQSALVGLKYQQAQAQYAIKIQAQATAEARKKQAEQAEKTAQNILKLQTAQTQSDINKVKNTSDTIEHLKNADQDVTTDDYSTLNFWMDRDEQLAELAATQQAGIFSEAFIARLTELMESDQNSILSEFYNTAVDQAQAEVDRIKGEIEENNKNLITEEQYQKAQRFLDTADDTDPKQSARIEAARQIVKLYQDAAIYKEKDLELTQQLDEANTNLLEQQNQQAEAARQVTEQAQNLLDVFTELSDKVMSQGLFGEGLEGQQLVKWQDTLKQIGEQYADLQDAVIMLQHTELAGTQAYAQALGRVRAALNATTIKELVDKANAVDVNQLSEDLDISVNSEEFDTFAEQVEQFLEADRELNIEIHSQAQDDFERLSQELDDIYNTASKIGENFIVAADDLRELNQVFPGIIDGMQLLSDGSYQLRSDVVQNAIAAATQSTAADAEAVTTRLQAQASELRAKAAIYQSMADAAGRLASDQTMSAQQKAANIALINKGQKDLQQENAEIAAEQQMENYAAVTQNANANAGAAADAIASSSNSQAQSIFQFAQNAIANYRQVGQAARDAANEEVTSAAPVPPGGIGSHFKGVSAIKGAAVGARPTKSTVENNGTQDWAGVQARYQAQADSLNAAANDIDGMIAQIGAKMGDMGSGLGNIASGYGKNGPSGKGKGGGGGGGGGKAKDPDFMQALEDQADRYHDIDIQLKHIADDLEKLQDEQDKFIGKNLVKNLNEQLKVLNDQVAAYETKIELARQEADEVRNSLKSQGVTFAADGDISNYASALYNKLASVNKVINHYNNLSAEAQEGYKDTVEAAKQEYEDFKKQIERYDELISEVIPDLEKSIRDSINKQIEVNIAKFKIKVDLELDLSKAERDWNKFRKKVIDQIRKDDVLGNVQASFRDMFSYYKDGYDVIQALTEQVTGTLEQLYSIDKTGTSSIYGDNQAQALEDLKKYMSQLTSNLEDIEDLVDDIKDSIFDAIDDAQDAFDEQVDEFEFISDLIDHDVKLLELLYGDDAYQSLDKYYALQQDNNNKQLDFLRQQKQLWYDRMMLEQSRMNNLPQGSNAWKEANDRLEEYKKHWMDATKDLNKLVESSIQTLTDKYGNIVDKIFNDFNDNMTGGKGLDYIEEEWELINQQADMYLDKVNSMYEIDKLENAYKDAIKDNDGNLAAQRSLNDMMEEQLKYLKDKDKLTQYDVDRANALLQIEIKRLALEQTRQNKTKLRLRRDSQGNYTYQYVANEEETSEAEQDLADARNSLYNLTKEAYKSNLDSFYDMTTEWQDKVKDVYKDTTLTVEEQQQKVMLLNQYYGDMINGLLEQNEELKRFMMQDTFDELAAMYEVDVTNFQDMTNEEKDILMDEMIPYWDSGIQEMENRFAGQGGFVPTVQGSMKNLDQATKDYQDSLNDLAATAGVDFGDVRNGIDETIIQTQELLENNEDLITSYENELDAVQRVIDQVDDLTIAYNNARNAAIAASQAAYQYQQAQRNLAASGGGGISSYSGGTSNIYSTSTSAKVTSTGTASKTSLSGGGGGGSGSGGGGIAGAAASALAQAATAVNKLQYDYRGIPIQYSPGSSSTYTGSSTGMQKVTSYKTRFDTGGYTGSWGPQPKIAALDEKELVLNATDTRNILDAVNIVRDINAIVNGLDSGFGMIDRAGTSSSTTLDQNVHITAQFPGVTEHTEIEKAFENLVNRASQFAFNTKR